MKRRKLWAEQVAAAIPAGVAALAEDIVPAAVSAAATMSAVAEEAVIGPAPAAFAPVGAADWEEVFVPAGDSAAG